MVFPTQNRRRNLLKTNYSAPTIDENATRARPRRAIRLLIWSDSSMHGSSRILAVFDLPYSPRTHVAALPQFNLSQF